MKFTEIARVVPLKLNLLSRWNHSFHRSHVVLQLRFHHQVYIEILSVVDFSTRFEGIHRKQTRDLEHEKNTDVLCTQTNMSTNCFQSLCGHTAFFQIYEWIYDKELIIINLLTYLCAIVYLKTQTKYERSNGVWIMTNRISSVIYEFLLQFYFLKLIPNTVCSPRLVSTIKQKKVN